MVERTITPKEMLLKEWEAEYQTTLKLLKAYPADRADFKPAEKSKTAKELAYIFVSEEELIGLVIDGTLDFSKMGPQHPSTTMTFRDVIAAYERAHRDIAGKLNAWRDEDLDSTIKFPTGPRRMEDLPKSDICWFMLKDEIHHRGQLSVYLRLVGAKVPSIYGPTADEPWM
jgi:uncharacterized damage-inducible protein DinB